MSATPGTLEQLASALAVALAPLAEKLEAGQVRETFEELGLWFPPELGNQGPFLDAIGVAIQQSQALPELVEQLVQAIEAGDSGKILQSATDLIQATGKLIVAIDQIASSLKALANSLPGVDPSEVLAFCAELTERIIGYALIEYLFVYHPTALKLLALAGLVEVTYDQNADDPDFKHPVYIKRVLKLERIGDLLKSPIDFLRTEYGWGEQTFDGRLLFGRIAELLTSVGIAAEVQGFVDGKPLILQLPWLNVRANHMNPPGLDLTLETSFGDTATAPFLLSDAWRVELQAKAAFSAGLVISISPPASVSAKSSATVEGGLSLQLIGTSADPGRPFQILGVTSGMRLEAQELAFGILGDLKWDIAAGQAVADFGFAGLIKGGKLHVGMDQADGFLSKILSGIALDAKFDVGFAWSGGGGFHFTGSDSLEIQLPSHISLGPVELTAITLSLGIQDGKFPVGLTTVIKATLGPVQAVVEQIGASVNLSFPANGHGNLGPAQIDFGFKPPKGVGIAIDATAVVGGGYLFFDKDKEQYAGVLQLEIAKTIAIKAIGLLTTRMPDGSKGFSLLVIITAEGFGPIQLGFGFTLTGIGGLLGVNRTCVVDTLRSGIKNGTVGSILFPQDPVRNAPRIVSDVGSVFPPALHRYVFGPMVKINWGTPPILTMEIGLVLEVPDPIRLLILGRLLAVLPEEKAALVRIRMDSLGVIDFGKGEISLDATLYDSRILAFVLTGDMALRANFGANPNFLLSVGGWNPAFPSPPGFPLLARMAITLSSSDNARLRLESYMAITSNTVQFGACVDLYFAVQPFSLEGYLGFDALFHFSPFSLQANLSASVTIRMNGAILMSVGLDATLIGPSPWHIWGSAHFSVLCFKQSVSFDVQYGPAPPPALPPAVDVKSLLTAALNDVRNWSSELPAGERPLVTFRAAAAGGSVLSVHPLAELAVRERVAPLDMTISKFGSAPVSGENSFSLKAVRTDGTEIPSVEKITDSFALAQFQDMSDDQKLSSPSFVQETAGIRFTTGEFAFGYEPALDSSITYTTLLIVPAQPAKSLPQYTMPAAVLDGTISMGAAAQAAKKRPSGLGVRAA